MKSTKNKKKLIITILAALPTIGIATVTAAILAYDSIYARYDRPNYDLVLGEYYYERVKEELPRQELYYFVNDTRLRGYYYKSDQEKGLVVISHGLHAGGDDYLPIIKYLVKNGYNVFSFDNTGIYDSDGENAVGMCQAIIDLEGTINYIKQETMFSNLPIFLLGHSWGAYAVTSVLALCDNIKGVAAIAPMNNGCKMMVDKAEEYVGKIGTVPGPIFSIYQKLLFGKYVNYNGVNGINSVNIPVLIAHGIEDKVINFEKQSIIAYKDEITNENVQYYVGLGLQSGHDTIWHSIEAIAYQKKVESEIKYLELKKGKELTKEELIDYYSTINHELYSAVNEELMNQIIEMFDSQI